MLESLPRPFLFRQLAALSHEQHLGLGLRPKPDGEVLGHTQVLPLNVGEFVDAMAHCPIVFAREAPHHPFAVLGVDANRNAFMDDDAQWQPQAYVPLYARCHPFILGMTPGATRATVMMDPASPQLVPLHEDDDAKPLFGFDGQPAQALAERVQLLQSQHQAQHLTQLFCQALVQAQLLVPVRADFQKPDGTAGAVQGFLGVNEKAYRALPDATLAQWARQGWSDAITLHLASMRQWPKLAAMSAAAVA